MECSFKIIALVILFSISPLMDLQAIDYNPPADAPTLAVLIDAHKVMKEAELKALGQIEVNYVEQGFITNTTKKFNEVKTTLNSKMSDVNSYLLLASSIAKTSLSLKKAIEDYTAFTKNSVDYISDSPLTSAYYADAQYRIAKEIKHVTKLIAGYTASGMNILKASNDEKIKMIFLINASISQIRDTIYYADIMMRSLIRTGYKVYYIKDILTSEVLNDISGKLTRQWNEECK